MVAVPASLALEGKARRSRRESAVARQPARLMADVLAIAVAGAISGVVLAGLILSNVIPGGNAHTLALLEAAGVMAGLSCAYLGHRLAHGTFVSSASHRVLIYGAGDAGKAIAAEMRALRGPSCAIGFIDDDPGKAGQSVNGLLVHGDRESLARVVRATHPDEVLVAIPSASGQMLREIVASLEPFDVPISALPNTRDVADGRARLADVRPLAIEDLLRRRPTVLDPERVGTLIKGKRVLVTGAAGSIGSELCRQIAQFAPELLVVLDRAESALYALDHQLPATTPRKIAVADVTDTSVVDRIFAAHRPEIVFHAAAYKHVPLMEEHPCTAVKNNVTGTRTVHEAAKRFGAERFVLISTDKAVNPTSVMGATKRVCERIVLEPDQSSSMICSAVRFGNVLGSNGSVIPLFQEQIARGGPVTVTDPEVRRFFMLIPEAVTLALHASCLAEGGDLLVLEMGDQVRILDVARSLIRLSGFRPDHEVAITFTGMRMGEKLEEELVEPGERTEPSDHPSITRVHPAPRSGDLSILVEVTALEDAAWSQDVQATIAGLRRVVPTFTPSGPLADEAPIEPRSEAERPTHEEQPSAQLVAAGAGL